MLNYGFLSSEKLFYGWKSWNTGDFDRENRKGRDSQNLLIPAVAHKIMYSFLFEFSVIWLSLRYLFQLNDFMISESTYSKTLSDFFPTHNQHFVGQLVVFELMWSCPCESEVAAAGLRAELWGFMAEFSFQVMCTGLLHLERKTNIWLSYKALKAEWKRC